jgi:hypothetical protein
VRRLKLAPNIVQTGSTPFPQVIAALTATPIGKALRKICTETQNDQAKQH